MADSKAEVVLTTRYDERAGESLRRLAADMNALALSGAAMGGAEEGMNRALQAAESFSSQYAEIMTGMSNEVQDAMTRLIEGGYIALARAMAQLATSGEGAARIFGKAMLELSARAVLAIGQQAAVKAVFALAEGLLFKDPAAFAAAKLYGAVAAMSLAVGSGMMAAASKMNTGGASGSGAGAGARGGFARPVPGAAASEQAAPGVVVNIRVEGNVVDTRAFVEEHVVPAVADAVGRGVAARGQYNLLFTKD